MGAEKTASGPLLPKESKHPLRHVVCAGEDVLGSDVTSPYPFKLDVCWMNDVIVDDVRLSDVISFEVDIL